MTTAFTNPAKTVAQGAAPIARAAPEAMRSVRALGAAAGYGADALRACDQMACTAGG